MHSCAMRSAVKPDSATIVVPGEHSSISGIASKPSRTGIARSRSTTSGLSSPTPVTPSRPSDASPTTSMRGSSSSVKRISARKAPTSSTRNTRTARSATPSSEGLMGRTVVLRMNSGDIKVPVGPTRVPQPTSENGHPTSPELMIVARSTRPAPHLLCAPMAPLITPDEARTLGEITDHSEIEALVERAWQARQEQFGDSTDLCSLVNAKSGGCAEDCGFCAQSRFAEAETPLHAMMDPDQILEHARAAEAAGAHRFCMVTQGQGLSKRDFERILEGARLVAEHTNLKRCASIGHMSVERATQLREAGIQRVHHNVETSRSYYPEVATTVTYDGRVRTIQAVKEAGLETCVGGILNLGESEEQRVEMAFELAELDPTSVPINLLNPRSGTKFGDRLPMDAWEVVKWVAIFRLVIPGALFRLCGGRVENLGDLQPLAVKAGLNGVMMGNFLTTLGAEPEEDRAMFEELGLNV